tara:strand:+ start:33 stop:233 length:201 start_codon:yes stop_codon:yes gene_type:complete
LLAASAFVLYHGGSEVSLDFWSFLMAEKKETMVDRERARVDTEEIFRLMRGNGNQSRINDGKWSPS